MGTKEYNEVMRAQGERSMCAEYVELEGRPVAQNITEVDLQHNNDALLSGLAPNSRICRLPRCFLTGYCEQI